MYSSFKWESFVQVTDVSFKKTEFRYSLNNLNFTLSEADVLHLHTAIHRHARTARTALEFWEADREYAACPEQMT